MILDTQVHCGLSMVSLWWCDGSVELLFLPHGRVEQLQPLEQKVVSKMILKIIIYPIGLGLGDEPVYVGYIVTFGWILVIYFLAIAFFRTE